VGEGQIDLNVNGDAIIDITCCVEKETASEMKTKLLVRQGVVFGTVQL
jgi:hypothetical protein